MRFLSVKRFATPLLPLIGLVTWPACANDLASDASTDAQGVQQLVGNNLSSGAVCDAWHTGPSCKEEVLKAWHIHRDNDGTTTGVSALGVKNSLFQVVLPDEDGQQQLLDVFRKWLVQYGPALGHPGLAKEDLAGLSVSTIAPYRNGPGRIFNFEQKLNGVPVDGSGRYIAVHVRDDGRVDSFTGRVTPDRGCIDPGINNLTLAQAQSAAVDAYEDLIRDTKPTSPNAGFGTKSGLTSSAKSSQPYQVTELRLVALPDQCKVAYRARVVAKELNHAKAAEIVIDARNGETLWAKEHLAEQLATIEAPEMLGDPSSTTIVDHSAYVSEFGNTLTWDASCGGFAKDYRLGDHQRVATWDFEGGESLPFEVTTSACADSPAPVFAGGGNQARNARKMHVGAVAGLGVIDPLMGEMFSHGSAHSYSWNHDPSTPDVAHRAPLLVFANKPCGNGGIYTRHNAAEDGPFFEDVEAPVPHPMIFGADGEYEYSAVNACNHSMGTLFHELGHYYDDFNAHGVMGEGGENYGECCLDRPHEAAALAEATSQLFAMFLARRLYPDLTYTLDNLAPADQCQLGSIGGWLPVVAHPDCGGVVYTLNDQRPTTMAGGVCNKSVGYRINGMNQAYWELINGMECSQAGGSLSCFQHAGATNDDYADRWMEALLSALQMGNHQSIVQLWDNMEAFIQTNYPGELSFLQQVRALHELQPLPQGLDPDCACPKLNGTCG